MNRRRGIGAGSGRWRPAGVGVGATAVLLLAACGSGGGPDTSLTPLATPPPLTSVVPTPVKASPGSVTKVLTVMEENHSLSQSLAEMPYLNKLAHHYAYATNYTAVRHSSEPNYLAVAGGSTFGVTNDDPVSQTAPRVGKAASVFDQAIAAGKSAKTYVQSMQTNCDPALGGLAPVKHNPWVFFKAGRANCEKFDVPSGTASSGNLIGDIRANNLPNVGFVAPDLLHDAHDGSLLAADAWLTGYLPALLASSDFTSGRLAVVITADEDDNTNVNKVLTVVLQRGLSHVVVRVPLNHYSLTRLYAQVAGSTPLLAGNSAPDLAGPFHLKVG